MALVHQKSEVQACHTPLYEYNYRLWQYGPQSATAVSSAQLCILDLSCAESNFLWPVGDTCQVLLTFNSYTEYILGFGDEVTGCNAFIFLVSGCCCWRM
jgi:hypothetical protein